MEMDVATLSTRVDADDDARYRERERERRFTSTKHSVFRNLLLIVVVSVIGVHNRQFPIILVSAHGRRALVKSTVENPIT